MDPDSELLRKCWEGDPTAFRDLVHRYEGMVYSLARRTLRSDEEADDAAQEVFLNVFRSIPFFRGDCTVKTWVYRIAVNECIARSKRRKRRESTVRPFFDGEEDDIGSPSHGLTASEALERDEEARRVRAAVAKLPEKYRVAMILRYFDGLSYDEVSDALDVPLNTLKVWLYRAKGLLREELQGTLGKDAG